MALTSQQTVVTYSSTTGSVVYLFDIVVDAQGNVFVRNIRSPKGLIQDPYTPIPDSVLNDIEEAKGLTEQGMSETQVDSGTLTFTGQTQQTATIPAGVLNNTSYRVIYTTPDGTILQTTTKTLTSFIAVAPTTYGSVSDPKTVSYVVLVATQQASATGATLTFAAGESVKAVTFVTAFETDQYRVMLSPDGFFVPRVTNQTKTGFMIQLPFTVPAAETVTVGYDVFV